MYKYMLIFCFIKLKCIHSYVLFFIYFKSFNEIQKAVVIEKDTVIQVSKEIVDVQNQSIDDNANELNSLSYLRLVYNVSRSNFFFSISIFLVLD